MRGLLAFLAWWQATGWVWVFFLILRHGYARLEEPNLPVLCLEFSLAISLSLFTLGYMIWLALRSEDRHH